MGKLMIVNGSPRAPKSNSKQYIQAFLSAWSGAYEQYSVTQRQHAACLEQLKECSDLLLVFPVTKLVEFATELGSKVSSLATVASLLKKYENVYLGFAFSK